MAHLIDKSAVVAEIIRRRKAIPKEEDDKRLKAVYGNEAFVLTDLLSFIDILEVKEVDDKSTWSEEDEKIIKRIDSLLYSQCTIHGSEYENIHNWLKSIKKRIKGE